MIEINLNQLAFKETKEKIKNILDNDGIIVYPTDTLYGIGGNFFSEKVIKKIDDLKQRNDSPYSIIVPNIEYIKKIAEINNHQKDILKKNLPGKFTFILRAKNNINKILLKGRDTIGIRIPNLREILDLVKFLDYPLITTSINKSGETPLNNPEQIKKEFYEIDIIINSGVLKESKGSTIVDITSSTPTIVRFGDSIFKA